MLQLVCNSVVSHLQLLCHKSIAKPYRRQEVRRSFCRKNTDFFKTSRLFIATQAQQRVRKRYSRVALLFKISRVQQLLHIFGDVRVRFILYIHVFICIYLHNRFLCTLLWRFAMFPSPLHSHRKQIRAAAQYTAQQFLYKKAQKETAAQKYATASHNSGYAIEIYSGQLITEQPLLPRSA